MSTKQWGGLSSDTRTWSHHDTTHSATSSEQRRDAREDVAWDEDLESSVYGDTSWIIPGRGDQPESCGRWYPDKFCDDGHVSLGVSRCENRACPECYWSWGRTRAEKIVRRLGAARHAADSGQDKRLVHVVASPPEGDVQTDQQFYDAQRDAYALAKEKGVRGGVLVPHRWRLTQDAKERFREAQDAGFSGGAWKWVRESDTHWRDLTYFSPHFHIFGLARDVGENSPDEDDGWVFKRIRSFDSFQLHQDAGYQDMAGGALYLLSHASFQRDERKQVVRWFGSMAPAAFSPEEELSEGALAVVERKAAEAAGTVEPTEEGTEGGEEEDRCPRDGCDCQTHPIWQAGEALQNKNWCEQIGEDRQREVLTAFQWFVGEVVPPPGLRNPRSRKQAEEAFEALL